MIILSIRSRHAPPRREALVADEIRIGRGPGNDIVLADDPSVSRVHARLRKTGSTYEIADLGSRNGVRVNDRLIEEPVRLQDGDRIFLGDIEIHIGTDAPPSDVKLSDDFPIPHHTEVLQLERTPTSVFLPPTPGEESSESASPGDLHRFFAELTHAVITQRDRDQVLVEIVDRSLDIITAADRGCILLIEDGDPHPVVARRRGSGSVSMEVSRSVVREVIRTRGSVRSLDVTGDPRFAQADSVILHGICSVMCVPMESDGELVGVLYVDALSPIKRFSRDDLKVFYSVGNIAAGYIQRQRLMDQTIRQRVMNEQLRWAAEIQNRLLEIEPPEVAGYEFHTDVKPCYAVGGDYVDILHCGEKLVLVIGDVSGKGVPAAILMATLQAAVHAQASINTNILEFVRRVNDFLLKRTRPERFATLFIGCLEPGTGHLTYVNAGHDSPLLLRRGSSVPQWLERTAPLVGALEGADFALGQAETVLEPGDLLVLYTDGIREQPSPEGEEFGEEGILRCVLENRELDTCALGREILSAVSRHGGNLEQWDDMTELLVRRLP